MQYKVYIGTERNQFVTQRVLQHSIDSTSTKTVITLPIKQQTRRVGGTNFGFVRFTVPSLNSYEGLAVYLDADQVVLSDITQLFHLLPESHSLGLVTNAEGTFGGKEIHPGNQSSVMVLDCGKLRDWKIPTLFDNVVPNRSEVRDNEIRYRDFMSLSWYDQSQIFSIPATWNHFNIIKSDTNIVHFSHVRSQPWRDPAHALSDWWNEHLVATIRAGYLSRTRLRYEIYRGHIHQKFSVAPKRLSRDKH